MSRKSPGAAGFREALVAALGEAEIRKGVAVAGEGPDFLWAVESEKPPALFIDDQPAPGKMRRLNGSPIWWYRGTLRTGASHRFHYVIGGDRFGGRNDIPAYGPDSYEKPGVPAGKLSEKFTHVSRIYEGMTSEYWVYAPAQYHPSTPACLMVWQDGQGFVDRAGSSRLQIVTDNLIHQKKIPVMVHVLIAPGRAGDRAMRSIQYDTVSDRYPRFLRDEILPEVYKKYNIRRDAYSRGIAGQSSGGICSFNAAWHHPDQFSRVLSRIGSYTALQWRLNQQDGGQSYPNLVRREEKRNIRIWMDDGAEDLENRFGSWPLQNIQMANSLKMRGYDFRFSYGGGTHSTAHGNAELPEALTWLWRDYDPSKTEQIYEQEASEKAKPLFRVRIYNRD
jgi:enterochelin esterase family protein